MCIHVCVIFVLHFVMERVDEENYPLNIRSVLLIAAGLPPGLLLEAIIFLGCLSAPILPFAYLF